MFKQITLKVPHIFSNEMNFLYNNRLGLNRLIPICSSGLNLTPLEELNLVKDNKPITSKQITTYQYLQPNLFVSISKETNKNNLNNTFSEKQILRKSQISNPYIDAIGTKLFIFTNENIEDSKVTTVAIKLPESILENIKNFYCNTFNMKFQKEQHNNGPIQFSYTESDIVFELYPIPNKFVHYSFSSISSSFQNILPTISLKLPVGSNEHEIIKKVIENVGKILKYSKNGLFEIKCPFGYTIQLLGS